MISFVFSEWCPKYITSVKAPWRPLAPWCWSFRGVGSSLDPSGKDPSTSVYPRTHQPGPAPPSSRTIVRQWGSPSSGHIPEDGWMWSWDVHMQEGLAQLGRTGLRDAGEQPSCGITGAGADISGVWHGALGFGREWREIQEVVQGRPGLGVPPGPWHRKFCDKLWSGFHFLKETQVIFLYFKKQRLLKSEL